jgi:uncharacterized protein
MGIERNPAVAAILLHQAADMGHAPSQFLVACLYEELDTPDHTSALYWLRKAARQNLPDANALISVFHRNGWGVPKSDEEANNFLLLAANAGHAHSQYLFGQVCAQALGVSQNHETAVSWYRAAANRGDADAMLALGNCYQNGQGVAADREEAKRWLEKAAGIGNVGALFNRAALATTIEEGLTWAKPAAMAGIAEAQFALGIHYAMGNGLPKSKTAAIFWYKQAAAQGHEGAKQRLASGNLGP